jgi:hypothetical protein
LIIGALFGLGAALAVAVYITRCGAFMNKWCHATPTTTPLENQKLGLNPNAGLILAKTLIKTPPPRRCRVRDRSRSRARCHASGSAVVPPAKVAACEKSNDPLGDLAKAKSAAAPSLIPVLSRPLVQVLNSVTTSRRAFRTPEDAENSARAQCWVCRPVLSEREQSGRTVNCVRSTCSTRKTTPTGPKDRLK